MSTLPAELIEVLTADPKAAALFAALHRHDQTAKRRWVESVQSPSVRLDRARQVVGELHAQASTRRAVRDRHVASRLLASRKEDL